MFSTQQLFLLVACAAAFATTAYAVMLLLDTKKRALKTLEQLIGAIGHDLRSPLQTIQSATSLLGGNLNDLDKEQFATAAKSSVGLISSHIEDMVRIARDQPLAYAPAGTDMEAWCAQVEATYRPKAVSKGLTWEFNVKTLGQVLAIDASRLNQCVGYLLDNAIRYTHQGHIKITFEFNVAQAPTAGVDDGEIQITVEDTGPGLSRGDKARMTAPFHIAIAGKSGKLSRGLAMANKIAIAAAGNLTVNSNTGAGATFTLRIPAKRTTLPNPVVSEPPVQSTPAQQVSGAEVLIVDSASQQLEAFTALLEDAGFSVVSVGTEAAGLDHLANAPFGVVVSDIGAEIVNGYTFAEKRKRPTERPYFVAIDSKTKPVIGDSRAPLFSAVLDISVPPEAFLDAIEEGLRHTKSQQT